MVTVSHFETTCPHCGRVNDRHAGDGGPEVGSGSFCWKCGKVAIFDKVDGAWVTRLPTAVEQAEVESLPDYWAAVTGRATGLKPSESAGRAVREES